MLTAEELEVVVLFAELEVLVLSEELDVFNELSGGVTAELSAPVL